MSTTKQQKVFHLQVVFSGFRVCYSFHFCCFCFCRCWCCCCGNDSAILGLIGDKWQNWNWWLVCNCRERQFNYTGDAKQLFLLSIKNEDFYNTYVLKVESIGMLCLHTFYSKFSSTYGNVRSKFKLIFYIKACLK